MTILITFSYMSRQQITFGLYYARAKQTFWWNGFWISKKLRLLKRLFPMMTFSGVTDPTSEAEFWPCCPRLRPVSPVEPILRPFLMAAFDCCTAVLNASDEFFRCTGFSTFKLVLSSSTKDGSFGVSTSEPFSDVWLRFLIGPKSLLVPASRSPAILSPNDKVGVVSLSAAGFDSELRPLLPLPFLLNKTGSTETPRRLLNGTTLTWPRCWCWGWKTTWGGYIPGFSFRADLGERPRTRMTGGFGTPWAEPEPNQFFSLITNNILRTDCLTVSSIIS